MREIDRIAIKEYGIPETILMENAGLQSIVFLEEIFGSLKGKRFSVFCGKGNNGGDGFVVARHMLLKGNKVIVYLLSEKKSLKGDAKLNMEIFQSIGGSIVVLQNDAEIKEHESFIRDADIIVDALLGTGISSELKGIYKTVVEKINEWKRFCLSLDIPTGLCSDNGAVYPLNIKADATVSYGFPKTGLMFYPAAESVGKLKGVNISFPLDLLKKSACDAFILDAEYLRELLFAPPPSAHKGTFGHAVVAGGSTGMGGAIALSALSALKVGAGLSTAVVSKELSDSMEAGMPEVMTLPVGKGGYENGDADKLLEFAFDKSALLLGPGMGQGGNRTAFIDKIIRGSNLPLVIDADGLNNIAENPDILLKAKTPAVITPHPGEMARLASISTEKVNSNRLGTAKDFSKKFNCVTVLKGARTVVALPSGEAYLNMTGNPNLASGGTGDVLAGMITGFIAKGFSSSEAAFAAVYIHGLAADIYLEKSDAFSLSASELVNLIPASISRIVKAVR